MLRFSKHVLFMKSNVYCLPSTVNFFKTPLKKSAGCGIMYFIENNKKEVFPLKHIVTINKADLKVSAEKGGCGKCQSSCQSACKTSCTVANQKCASVDR